MTKPNILELAKQGNPQAIAALMNHSLNPKGITANVESEGDRLQVLLEGEQTPNQSVLTSFVRNGLSHLNLDRVTSVQVSGRQVGADQPAWTEAIEMKPPSRSAPIPGSAASANAPAVRAAVAPPPPPKRPIVPPPPPQQVLDLSPDTVIQADDEPDINPLQNAPDLEGLSPSVTTTIQANVSPSEGAIATSASANTYVEPSIEPTPAMPVVEQFDDLLVDEQFIDNLLADDELSEETIVSIVTPPESSRERNPGEIAGDFGNQAIGYEDDFSDTDFDNTDFDNTDFSDDDREPATHGSLVLADTQPDSMVSPSDADLAPIESATPDDTSTRPSPWIFILVFFIMMGWLAGMIGYSLWSHLSSPSTPADSASPQSALPILFFSSRSSDEVALRPHVMQRLVRNQTRNRTQDRVRDPVRELVQSADIDGAQTDFVTQ